MHVAPGDRVQLTRAAAIKSTSLIRLQAGDVGEVVRVSGASCLVRVYGVEVPVAVAHLRRVATAAPLPSVASAPGIATDEPVVSDLDLSFLDDPA